MLRRVCKPLTSSLHPSTLSRIRQMTLDEPYLRIIWALLSGRVHLGWHILNPSAMNFLHHEQVPGTTSIGEPVYMTGPAEVCGDFLYCEPAARARIRIHWIFQHMFLYKWTM